MDEPSPTACDVLAAYRRRRTLDDDAQARVQARLAVSIATHASAVRRESRRRIVIAGLVALAAAAAIVLAVRGMRSQPVVAERDDRGQAPYQHIGDDHGAAVDDATPPPSDASRSLPAPASPPAVAPAPVVTATTGDGEPRRDTASAEPPADAASGDASLAEELVLVRRIRSALALANTDAALAAIAEHERRFASGQLLEERKALRIEALCAADKAPQARAERATFLRDHAGSAHADRVRSACP